MGAAVPMRYMQGKTVEKYLEEDVWPVYGNLGERLGLQRSGLTILLHVWVAADSDMDGRVALQHLQMRLDLPKRVLVERLMLCLSSKLEDDDFEWPGAFEHTHVCMYVRMYVYMCICMYVCMCACMYVCTCMYVRMYVCMYVCKHVYVCVCMHVCMCVCVYVCMYVCIYIGVYMYVCMCVCNLVYLQTSY
jgi:hypothetical protein